MLRLSALYRYPLKSGQGQFLQSIGLDKLGLDGDRRWMLVDEGTGRFLTQRAVAKMSQLSALWNEAGGLTLSAPGFGTLDVALPPADEEQRRGVIIWRDKIGRASCRERVCQYVEISEVAVSLTKKIIKTHNKSHN